MEYDELKKQLSEYNWDDGFDVPKEILGSVHCDLALALEIFYLADGYSYLGKMIETGVFQEWDRFIITLYDDILDNRFSRTEASFQIPLNRVQKYQLQKNGVPPVFLTDL